MTQKEKILNSTMGKALTEFSTELNRINYPPVVLNVVGGFAMMIHGSRPADSITDIDYVGPDMSTKFNQIADRIGRKYKMGEKWINNETILSDSSQESFEYATGKLHFDKTMQIGDLTINALNPEDLLRLKIIALDTALTGMEANGKFTRFRDLEDIQTLIKEQNLDYTNLPDQYKDFIINDNTENLIQCYMESGKDAADNAIDLIREKTLQEHRHLRMQNGEYQRTPYIENLLNSLMNHNDFER